MKSINYLKTTLILSLSFVVAPYLMLFDANKINVNNTSLKNFEQDNILSLNDEYNSFKNMTSFSNVDYDDFVNKNLNIYFHIYNKQEVIYAFVKNIFVYNINKYLNILLAKHLNINYPKFKFVKQQPITTNSDIFLDYEFDCENNKYLINKNKSLINMFSLDESTNKITLNLSLLENDKEIVLNYQFNNFVWCQINNIFNYDIAYFDTDVANIYYSNLEQLFQIYNTNPTNFVYDIVLYKNTENISVKNISYFFNTGIQKFNLVYTGKKIFEYKPIDVSIDDNKIIEKTNILKLDESEINNIFNIGSTIKTINYKLNLQKDLYKNFAIIRFDLYQIDNNLVFKDLLKKIKPSYEIKIDFNKNHLFSIDVNKEIKIKKLPITIKSNDIEITSTKPLDDLTILSKYIKSFDNKSGTIDVVIKYEYKNYFNQTSISEINFQISNLLQLNYKSNEIIINELKNKCYLDNQFNLDKFKSFFTTSNKNDWLLESENLYIDNKGFEARYSDGILYISFFINNHQNESIYKDFINIDLKNNIINKPNDDNQSNNNGVKTNVLNPNDIYKYIAITIGVLIALITIILIVIKLKKKSKIRLK